VVTTWRVLYAEESTRSRLGSRYSIIWL